MRCISLHQPWASLIGLHAKSIETRAYPTNHRGYLAIHAAKVVRPEYKALCGTEMFWSVLHPARLMLDPDIWEQARGYRPMPLGAIVAVARLVAVYPTARLQHISAQERAFGDYGPGRFGWMLEDVVALPEPVITRGYQGLWELRPEVEAQVREQMRLAKRTGSLSERLRESPAQG